MRLSSTRNPALHARNPASYSIATDTQLAGTRKTENRESIFVKVLISNAFEVQKLSIMTNNTAEKHVT